MYCHTNSLTRATSNIKARLPRAARGAPAGCPGGRGRQRFADPAAICRSAAGSEARGQEDAALRHPSVSRSACRGCTRVRGHPGVRRDLGTDGPVLAGDGDQSFVDARGSRSAFLAVSQLESSLYHNTIERDVLQLLADFYERFLKQLLN